MEITNNGNSLNAFLITFFHRKIELCEKCSIRLISGSFKLNLHGAKMQNANEMRLSYLLYSSNIPSL